ncbi:vWA domain-containing protein [Actinomycetospora sp. NBRC 106375]|uniref:vWA domain-containing protein n=1 Tax=Actinomycetospora sp. NBRC 106375 TaxID=3032207 RepID=UPI0025568FA0|nr:vWA domain-containing protein [Actinomycetospora sp. NBRC 106375]
MSDPKEVEQLLRDQARRTETRADLSRRHGDELQQVSPTVGVLDEAAVSGAYDEDPDATVDLLADLARATDPLLRAAARRLAVRLLVPPARAGETERRGSSRLATVAGEGLDLDLDATLERSLVHRPIRAEDLRWRGWRSPGRAIVLLVDASGSVAGKPLSTAVTTAGALAAGLRSDDEIAVIAFWSRAVVLRHLHSPAPASAVLDSLLDLRGGSTTDLALGLRTALAQAAAARVPHADVLVLTDGAWNEGEDPAPVAGGSGSARIHTLVTVDDDEARVSCARLAAAGGGRSVPLHRPSDAPAAVRAVLRG